MARGGTLPIFRWTKDDGTAANGWTVTAYIEGSTTVKKDTYTTPAATVVNTNPITLNSRGEADIFFDGVYRLIIKDDLGTTQDDIDNYMSGISAANSQTESLIPNGSFEIDTNADGVADNWVKALLGSTNPGTATLVTTSQAAGTTALKIISVGGITTGGGATYTSENFLEINANRLYLLAFNMISTTTGGLHKVEIQWYDSNQTFISTSIVHSDSDTNPTVWTLKKFRVSPVNTARYAKIKITGYDSSDATGGTVHFDDIQLTLDHFISVQSGVPITIPDVLGEINIDTTNEIVYVSKGNKTTDDWIKVSNSESNSIINGDFNFWQPGITFPAAVDGSITADMWKWNTNGAGVVTVSRDTSVPTLTESDFHSVYSYKVLVTTADASLGATDRYYISHKLLGYDFAHFQNNKAVLSFWVAAKKTGIYCISFGNNGADRSYVSEYTINTTGTWEKKSIPITFDSLDGSWVFTKTIGLDIRFALASGETPITANTWSVGDSFITSNQVNAMDTINNDFLLSQVKLELGSVATKFSHEQYAEELTQCETFYQKSYDLLNAPGSTSASGAHLVYSHSTDTTKLMQGQIGFRTSMRTIPAVTLYSITTGASGKIEEVSVGDKTAIANTGSIGTAGFTVEATGLTINKLHEFQWVADASL